MTNKRFTIRPRLLFLAATLSFGLASGVHALDVYHVGNSLTNTATPGGIEAIAEGAGYEHDYVIIQGAGMPIWLNWERTTNIEPMSTRQWDAITLQPFKRLSQEYPFAKYYIEAMLGILRAVMISDNRMFESYE